MTDDDDFIQEIDAALTDIGVCKVESVDVDPDGWVTVTDESGENHDIGLKLDVSADEQGQSETLRVLYGALTKLRHELLVERSRDETDDILQQIAEAKRAPLLH
jgi:hypothetical protein